MCDYSLMAVPNRLAREGEKLIVHRFPPGSLGLAPAIDLAPAPEAQPEIRTFWGTVKNFFNPPMPRCVTAVCIPPGANLILHDIPAKLRNVTGCGSDEFVTFTQTSSAANTYRDAVRFRTGHEIRLQELRIGQRVEVLDLDMTREREPNREEFVEIPARFS